MVQGGVLFLDSNATYNFVAYALNGRLEGLAIEEPEEKYGVGNIYVGQVKRSLPSQNAAFIALDTEQSAYLDDAMALSDGDFVAVQVTRSTHNGKHARVSRNIRLYRQGISLTIQGPDSGTCSRVETLQSNQIFELINATPSDIAAAIAGQNTISSIDFHCVTRNLNYKLNTETLLSHAQELQRIVRDILECVRLCHKPQLYQQEHLVAEIISQWGIKRGYTNTFIAEDTVRIPRVIYASESAALLVKKLASEWQHLVSPLRSSTLDDHDMLQQISALTDRHVPLPEGGSCIVETTEAMVVIDVNSGSTSGRKALFRTNLAAAAEACRQLRLRNLGGRIIIEFAGDVCCNDKQKIEEAIRKKSSCRETSNFQWVDNLLIFTRRKTRKPFDTFWRLYGDNISGNMI